MEFLHWIASWRNPVLDAFFSVITYLGDEVGLIIVGLLFFWCISKRDGYYLLFVGFVGTVLNQFFKLVFRIERPWVRDPSFSPIESAKPGAGGYSFPSGHTQSSVGLFGGLAMTLRHRVARLLCLLPMILVPFSRLYLGVHTPADVLFSVVIALLLIVGFHYLLQWAWGNSRRMAILIGACLLLTLAYTAYAFLWPFPANIDAANLASGRKNAMKILGALLGIALVYFVDEKYLHFDVKAPLLGQACKLILGGGLAFAIKTFAKEPLNLLVGESWQNLLRYFILVVFAGIVWPLTFRFFSRLGVKKKDA